MDVNNLEFKPNSNKSKEAQATTPAEARKVERVVQGEVKIRKKSEARKFADIFISEDISNVKEYVFTEVLVPAVKKAISDIITNGIDMLLYGGKGPVKRSSGASNVSYRNYYDQRRADDERRYNQPRTGGVYSYDEFSIPTRGEAEDVLERMCEAIDTYNIVSVADYYDLIGVTPKHTDHKYGWTNLRNAEIVRVRDGYIIQFPKALPIN